MKNKNQKSKIENQNGEYIGYFPIDELNTILGGIKTGYHYEFNFYITDYKFLPCCSYDRPLYKFVEAKLKTGIRKRNVYSVVRGCKYNLYTNFIPLQKAGKIILLDKIQETRSNFEHVKKLGIKEEEMAREYERGIPYFQNLVLDSEDHLQRRRHIKEFIESKGAVINFDTTFEPEDEESPLRHMHEHMSLVECPYEREISICFYFNANLFDKIKKLNRQDPNLSEDELSNIDFKDPDLRIYKSAYIEVTGEKLTENIRTNYNFNLKLNILNGNLERLAVFSVGIFNQNYL